MTYGSPMQVNDGYHVDAHYAFDPYEHPDLYRSVRTRRIFAFLLDAVIILTLTTIGYVLIGMLGVITLGLAWLLFAAVFPVVAVLYTALTLAAPESATIGMRMFGLEMRLLSGERMYGLLAAAHVLLFWFVSVVFWPAIVITSLFSDRKRCLHDILVGTVVINRPLA